MSNRSSGSAAWGRPGGRSRAGTALVALAATAALTLTGVSAAQPARADIPIGTIGTILGDVNTVGSYIQTEQTLYGLYSKYILGNPSDLDQITALIKQSQQQIVGQIDAVATGQVNSEADLAVEQFENIETMSPDTLASFTSQTVKAVTDAKALAAAEPVGPALDNLGFDLSIVGPIALAASAKAGQATDILTTDIVQGDQTIVQKLTPQCGVFAVDLQDTGSVLSQGHCWSYAAVFPTNPLTSVPEFFHAKGIGSNSFTVHGNYDGFTYTPPAVSDFSQAAAQADAATSYPIAQAAIVSLAPAFLSEPPVSAITETLGGKQSAFGVTGLGNLVRGDLTPNPAAGAGRFTIGWNANFTGTPPQLKTVTSAINSDGRVEVFGLDRLGQIWHTWQTSPGDDASFSPWANIPGEVTSISVARNHNGTLELFGTGADENTYTRTQILGGDFATSQANPVPAVDAWTGWTALPGGGTSQDVAVTNLAGRIEVFGIGNDHAVYHREQNLWDATDPSVAGSWTTWSKLPGTPTDAAELAVAKNAAGKIFLASVGAGDQVSDVLKIDDRGRDTDYTSWGHLSGPIHHLAMAGLTQAPASIQLFGLDTAGTIFTDSLDGTASGTPAVPHPDTGWIQVPGELTPFPS